MSDKRTNDTDDQDLAKKKARELPFGPTFLNDKAYTVVTATVGAFYTNSRNTSFEPWSNWTVEFREATDLKDPDYVYFLDKFDRSNVFRLEVAGKFEDDEEWELLYRDGTMSSHIFGRRTGDRFDMDGPWFKMILSSNHSQTDSTRMISRASECVHTIARAVSTVMAQLQLQMETRFPTAVLEIISTTDESKWDMRYMIGRALVMVLIDKTPSAFIEPNSCVTPDECRCRLKATITMPNGSKHVVHQTDVVAMIDAIAAIVKITA
jgi:hypothetical protein